MATAEDLAKKMHETYERLAPQFGWETQKKSQKPWEEVPEENRKLMVAVITEVFTSEAIRSLTEDLKISAVIKQEVSKALQTASNSLRGILVSPGPNPGKRLLDLVGELDRRALLRRV